MWGALGSSSIVIVVTGYAPFSPNNAHRAYTKTPPYFTPHCGLNKTDKKKALERFNAALGLQ
jgi:hypothetical protein